ncbi:MAG: hypothetical protein V1809_04645 [Planctomycetota bacterium]
MDPLRLLTLSPLPEQTLANVLANLAPGDFLVVQVKESLGGGQYRLILGGMPIVAESPILLTEGAVLRLEVRETAPRTLLAILPPGAEIPAESGSGPSPVPAPVRIPMEALPSDISADVRQSLEAFADSARGKIPLNDRTMAVAALFLENGIRPEPELVSSIVSRVFPPDSPAPTAFSALAESPAAGGGGAFVADPVFRESAAAMLAVMRTALDAPAALSVTARSAAVTLLREILASRPELVALDALIGRLEGAGGEIPVAEREIVLRQARETAALIRQTMPGAASASLLEEAILTGNPRTVMEAARREESALLARLPETSEFRQVFQSLNAPERQASIEFLNALGRTAPHPFFYAEFLLPAGRGAVPVKFKASFRRRPGRKASLQVEHILIDLVLSRISRVVGELTVRDRHLDVVFWLETPEAQRLFEEYKTEVEVSLKGIGFEATASLRSDRRPRHPLLEGWPEFTLEDGGLDIIA